MHGFYGTFMHTLDPKNRVFVPAKLRNDLGESFFITRKLTKKALAVYPASEWEKLEARLNELPDSEVGDIKLFLFSHSVTAIPDSQGRILLTQSLVEYIKLNKNAVIIGCGRYAEIWAEDSYERMVAAEDAAAINEQLLDLGV